MSVSVKFSGNLLKNLENLSKIFPKQSAHAAGVVGLAVVQDVITQEPTAPVDTGFLRGSWSVFANGKKTKGGKDDTAPDSVNAPSGTVSTLVAFNADYAVYQEQNLAPAGTWKPGPRSEAAKSGGGFFSSKLIRFKERYMKIFVDEFEKEMRKKLPL